MIKALFNEMQKLDFFHSNGMETIPKMKGPGFFPGCIGTIDDNVDIKDVDVMVLGQDFDTLANYKKIHEIEGEITKNKTWQNLKTLLGELKIDFDNCFFTNAYMGLRSDSKKNTGASPASKKAATQFASECYVFFKRQLHIVKPKLVLVLGKETAKFLTKAFPNEFIKWEHIQTLKQFYAEKDAVFNDIEFEGEKIRFVFVLHPSMSNTNRSLIWGKGSTDEIRILNEALKARN